MLLLATFSYLHLLELGSFLSSLRWLPFALEWQPWPVYQTAIRLSTWSYPAQSCQQHPEAACRKLIVSYVSRNLSAIKSLQIHLNFHTCLHNMDFLSKWLTSIKSGSTDLKRLSWPYWTSRVIWWLQKGKCVSICNIWMDQVVSGEPFFSPVGQGYGVVLEESVQSIRVGAIGGF